MLKTHATTTVRVAYWRQAVASTPCAACGATAGHGCSIGKHPRDCYGCGRLATCGTGNQMHLVRFNAWLRPTMAR